MLRSCFLSSFVEFRSAVSEEKSKMSSQSEAGAAILFNDRPEKHKLGRGCQTLASYRVSLNSVQQFHRKSQKCFSQSEARVAILLKFLPSSWNSDQWFKGKSWKCLSHSETRVAILFFRSAQNTNLVEDIKVLLLVKFRWIPFSGFRGEKMWKVNDGQAKDG